MRWKSNYKHPEGLGFVIEYEKAWDSIGLRYIDLYYLIGFDKEDRDICNYFQEGLDVCQEQAFEKFGVPEDSWEETDEPSRYV